MQAAKSNERLEEGKVGAVATPNLFVEELEVHCHSIQVGSTRELTGGPLKAQEKRSGAEVSLA